MPGANEEAVDQVANVANVANVAEGDDADFIGGFDRLPTEVVAPAKTAEEETAPPAAPEYVQVTKADWDRVNHQLTSIDQIKADSKRGLDTAFGKVGSLEQRFAQLQSSTPAGNALEITDDIVADLVEEFPELGGRMRGVFQKIEDKRKGIASAAPAFDISQVEPLITTAKQDLAREILSIKHEDWEEVVGLPDGAGNVPDTAYRKWLSAQPADYQRELTASWDARKVAKSIDRFKTDSTGAAKAASDAARNPKPTASRKDRLAAAVTPRGEAGHVPEPTEDEFEAGFKSG